MKKIRILVADDHNIVRQSIVGLIEANPEVCIIAEAEDGEKLVEKYFKFKPDVVVTDISMPRLNGLEAAKKILASDSKAKIIFLSIHNTDEYIYKCLKIGAKGLVGKDILIGELINAIETVAQGERYFLGKNETEIKKIANGIENKKITDTGSLVEQLTHREKEVLRSLSLGLTSEEIADKLIVSKRVVDITRMSIMEKLGLKTLHQLIRFAVEYWYEHKEIT